MAYRIVASQFFASTYGNAFTPTSMPLMHTLASSLPDADLISSRLCSVINTDSTPTVLDPSDKDAELIAAKALARTIVTDGLNSGEASPVYELSSSTAEYIPLVRGGVVIGHDSLSWLYKNGAPVQGEVVDASGQPMLHMFGVVYFSIAVD